MPKHPGAKLPKSIAGVKIPKELRKAGLLDRLVRDPAGRAILAEAIVAAAQAAATVLAQARSPDDEPAREEALPPELVPPAMSDETEPVAAREAEAPPAHDAVPPGEAPVKRLRAYRKRS